MEKPLYSWDPDWEYPFTDVFPELSRQGRLFITQNQLGNSSIVTMTPGGMDHNIAFDLFAAGSLNSTVVKKGMAGAF
jgi:hypothetical protein